MPRPSLLRRRLAFALAAAPATSWPQALSRQGFVGILSYLAQPPRGTWHSQENIFVARLRDLGWFWGRNLRIEVRYADTRSDLLPRLAAELVALRPDLIVARGTTQIAALHDATTAIPIVMAGSGDPVGTGLAASLARPGGNVTGVSLMGQELVPKALSLLREIVPGARRIELLGNAANPANPYFSQVFAQALRTLGLEGDLVEGRDAGEMESLIGTTRAEAMLTLADPIISRYSGRLATAAIRRQLPLAITSGRNPVAAGFLFSYATSPNAAWVRAADYADRILRGAKPIDLPIEQPSHYELFVNMRTARAIGAAVPKSMLLSADEVIE